MMEWTAAIGWRINEIEILKKKINKSSFMIFGGCVVMSECVSGPPFFLPLESGYD